MIFEDNRRDKRGDVQGWWSRLNYTNVQVLALREYDAGRRGHSLENLFTVLVPRFLWRDKPNITATGQDFNELAIGNRESSLGLGIYGDAYWNGGWLACVLTGIGVGAIFAFVARLSLNFMQNGEWLFLPCVFLGIRMGFRLDGWIVPDYAGGMAIYLGFAMVVHFARMFFGGSAKRRKNGAIVRPANRPIPERPVVNAA
jgi:hypothetical protein